MKRAWRWKPSKKPSLRLALTTKADLRSDWLTPNWPVPSHVRAVFTTRQGGQSAAPYDSMNLGDHVGDAPAQVAANRLALRQAMGATPVFMQQVHGTNVLSLDAGAAEGQQADAAITRQAGLACTIMVADCLPVLLATTDGRAVAAAHAGWRGLAGAGQIGVLENTYQCFCDFSHTPREEFAMNTVAWLGPCIGPTAFEVGPEVRLAFTATDPLADTCFAPQASGKYLADLAGLARLRLQALGITQIYGNDGSRAWCTVGNPSRFFSHRRDAGLTGRMVASVWIE
jgi:YfiH family protein